MVLLPFLPSSLTPCPSRSPNETSFYNYNNYMQVPAIVLHTNFDHFYFYGSRGVPTTRRSEAKREISESAIAHGNQNQYKKISAQKRKKPSVFLWNDVIGGFVKKGFCDEALRMYYQMQSAGIEPDKLVFVSVINACGSLSALQAGREIHEDIVARGFESDVLVGNALTSMYVKCRNLENARQVFDRLPKRDVVSWNAMIAGYSKSGQPHEALAFFIEMQAQGIKPNPITMASVLPACVDILAVEQGKQIHGYVIRSGFESDIVVGTGLVDMYAKCRNVNIAHILFERMPQRNVVSWNAIIAGYAKCGNINSARKLFERMPQRDVVSWNAIISGYSQNGHPHESLAFFNLMQVHGIKPNSSTMVSVLPVCADLFALEQGKQIHGYVIRSGFESNAVVGNGLVYMYAKCGNVHSACKMIERMPKRDVVSWNAIIAGYAQNGHPHQALAFFNEMQVHGIKPDSITMVTVLSMCADLLDLKHGKQIHGYVIRIGFESHVVVGTGLVNMYGKCGNVNVAHKLFDKMPKKDIVSWNAIIAGYSQNGHLHKALAFFSEMQVQGRKPNSITMASALPVCADLLALEQGKQIHGYVIRSGFEYDVFVCNGLVNMYAKCGNICIARQVFDKLSNRNVVSWNALILGYGIHGHGEHALALFSQMQQIGTKPNHITFIGVLTACSHAGLVDKGCQYFESMKSEYGLAPELDHYACLVDLLGRAGHLDEAHDIIKNMPLEPDVVIWGALLGACRIHCNIELGKQAAKHLFELEPNNAGFYVLFSNILAEAGRWEDVAKLRTMMKERQVKKPPGCSFIEVNREVHTFLVGERTHPQSEKIYTALETLYGQMKEAGYVLNTSLVLHDVEEEVKENMLCSHSERLAIAFGIINTSPGTPIQIIKNLRVCSDCHIATKTISKIVEREIIVRDTNRFHHFNHGLCSCGDYW